MNATTEDRVLACGHKPSEHGPHTTGTGWFRDEQGKEQEVCWECAYAREKEQMSKEDKFTAYLSLNKPNATGGYYDYQTRNYGQVTTWPGQSLGTVTGLVKRNHNMAGTMYYFNVRAFDGSEWYGTGTGDGMYCRLRRRKSRKH